MEVSWRPMEGFVGLDQTSILLEKKILFFFHFCFFCFSWFTFRSPEIGLDRFVY